MGALTDRGDAEIVAQVLAGDDHAFAILIGRHRDRYTRFAMRMLGSREDADDALQSAFVRAHRNLAKCEEPARFGAWLYQIAINECRTFATRRTRRELRLVRDDSVLERALTDTAGMHEADAMAVREEIDGALARLEPAQREAFVLKYIEELTYEEMAEITGVGISALKMRVKRGCERLRELLEGVHHA